MLRTINRIVSGGLVLAALTFTGAGAAAQSSSVVPDGPDSSRNTVPDSPE